MKKVIVAVSRVELEMGGIVALNRATVYGYVQVIINDSLYMSHDGEFHFDGVTSRDVEYYENLIKGAFE